MKPGFFPVLAPFSLLYGASVQARLQLFARGLLSVSRLPAPVISIGNLTTGGTGKTPLVEFVARRLAESGRRICILTRGYGRANPGRQVLVSDGESVLADAIDAGDEPRVLAENLRGLSAIISNAYRYKAGIWALENLKPDAFILDDGFQHLQLRRDLNIAVIDATQPWGNGHLLPWGQLREKPKGLARADCIVLTRTDQRNDLATLRSEIATLSENKPIFTSRMRWLRFRKLSDDIPENSIVSLDGIPQPVAVLCGIGNPTAFLKQLTAMDLEQIDKSVFADHHDYNQQELNRIVEKARKSGAQCLITTAKDAVKLKKLRFDLPCFIFDIEIAIDNEARFLELVRAAASAVPN